MKVYEIITNIIIEKLEQGTIPWNKPWRTELPKNMVSGKSYRGINIFILNCRDYACSYWLTFNQIKKMGGSVKTGEKGTPVVFWKWIDIKDEEEIEKKIPILRYYTVFNVSQCLNIAIPEAEKSEVLPLPMRKCEEMVENMPNKPAFSYESRKASYSPAKDMISIPPINVFNPVEEYYSTLFHEMVHATGHESRLNREGFADICSFGSTNYSKEELVAEMGAAYLCAYAGIEQKTIDNSSAYIQGWLKKLNDDKKFVIMAAASAQKATDYILNLEMKTGKEGDENV